MVTGEKPYDTKTLSTFQLQMKIVQEDLPKTSTNWDQFIEIATFKNSNDRFKDCYDFKNRFSTISNDFNLINDVEKTVVQTNDFKQFTELRQGNISLTNELCYSELSASSKSTKIKKIQSILLSLKEQQNRCISEKFHSFEKTIISTDELTHVESKLKNELIIYPTIQIGNQVWMTKNLDVDCFRNGDLIKEVKSTEEWQKAGQNGQPAWCYFENKLINDKKYGKLYNWYAVNDPRGLAPKGWHVPNYEEITILINYLGGKNIAGVKLKSELGWKKHFLRNGNGTNESFFNGFPGGYRSDFGFYNSAGYNGYWWILKDYASYYAFFLSLSANDDFVYRDNRNMSNGFSVRCIKD